MFDNFKIILKMNTLVHILMQYKPKEKIKEKDFCFWETFEGKVIVFALDKDHAVIGESESHISDLYGNTIAGMLVPRVNGCISLISAYGVRRGAELTQDEMGIINKQLREDTVRIDASKLLRENLEKVIHAMFVDENGAYASIVFREESFKLISKLRKTFKEEDEKYELDKSYHPTGAMMEGFTALFNSSDFVITEDRLDSLEATEAAMLGSLTAYTCCLDKLPNFDTTRWFNEYPSAVASITNLALVNGLDIENLSDEDCRKMTDIVYGYYENRR